MQYKEKKREKIPPHKASFVRPLQNLFVSLGKNAQNRFVFQNRYHLSEAIRKILIPSDKCSVDISDAGMHTIVPNQYN